MAHIISTSRGILQQILSVNTNVILPERGSTYVSAFSDDFFPNSISPNRSQFESRLLMQMWDAKFWRVVYCLCYRPHGSNGLQITQSTRMGQYLFTASCNPPLLLKFPVDRIFSVRMVYDRKIVGQAVKIFCIWLTSTQINVNPLCWIECNQRNKTKMPRE